MIMNARNQGMGVGFVTGLAIAFACRSTSTSTSSPVVDAHAADSAAIDAPPTGTTVPDRLRVRTAEGDIDQLEEGTTSVPARTNLPILVVAGPIVLTDVWPATGSANMSLLVSSTQDCGSFAMRPQIAVRHLGTAIHNVRVAVKAGEFLCASNGTDSFASFEWSGYRPYPAN